jgi:hypothetical protein
MSSEKLPTVSPPPGLPTVSPPSGKFLLELFVVPGVIVGVVVCLLLLANWLFSGSRSPEAFLRRLDDPNPEVRWRAASDLSQTLLRDPRLAADPAFALDLADRLEAAVDEGSAPSAAERSFAERFGAMSPEQRKQERSRLEPDRNYVQFLCACLGNSAVPAGAGLLEDLATRESRGERAGLALRRRQAVWALANLGENLKRFDALRPEEQDAVLAGLESAAGGGRRGGRAKAALAHLRKRREGRPDALGMDEAMARCAGADDPALRSQAAHALNFWHGTPAEEAKIEATLKKLAYDDGRGMDPVAAEAEDAALLDARPPAEREVLKGADPGLVVRINADLALARRGSPATRLDLLEQMLDEDCLRQTFHYVRTDTGEERPNADKAALVVGDALKAVRELHRHKPALVNAALRAAVERLAASPGPVQYEAKRTQQALAN